MEEKSSSEGGISFVVTYPAAAAAFSMAVVVAADVVVDVDVGMVEESSWVALRWPWPWLDDAEKALAAPKRAARTADFWTRFMMDVGMLLLLLMLMPLWYLKNNMILQFAKLD